MTSTVFKGFSQGFSVKFGKFDGAVTIEALGSTEWASVTFSGARHRLRITLEGKGAVGAAADFLEVLPDLEFDIPGHIVADIALLSEARRDGGCYAELELEALTIAE